MIWIIFSYVIALGKFWKINGSDFKFGIDDLMCVWDSLCNVIVVMVVILDIVNV